jgi:N-acetylmuramoyl-L-alanine amidase
MRRPILAAALIGALIPVAAPAHAAICKSGFRIALDVGHTPEAAGATSARGITEYSYNLQLARTVASTLGDGGLRQA